MNRREVETKKKKTKARLKKLTATKNISGSEYSEEESGHDDTSVESKEGMFESTDEEEDN